VAGPALLLALAGLVHPHELTTGSAARWIDLHLLLLPVFPLLGVAHWLLLRKVHGPLAWQARLAAFGYANFYTALDVLFGIGMGALVQRYSERGLPGVGSALVAGAAALVASQWGLAALTAAAGLGSCLNACPPRAAVDRVACDAGGRDASPLPDWVASLTAPSIAARASRRTP